MKRLWVVLLLLVSSTSLAHAQTGPWLPPIPLPGAGGADVAPVKSLVPAMPPLPLQVQGPTERMLPFDRVIYVLDVSCSMINKLGDAIAVTDVFASDGFKAAVVTFSSSHDRWAGVKVPCRHKKAEPCREVCLKRGWALMPQHRPELFRYLSGIGASGSTNPSTALDHAYKNAPVGTLIVLITDGQLNGNTHHAVKAVKEAKAWRIEQKLAPIQMLVWGINKAAGETESLKELAKLGGAGLWRPDTKVSGPW